MLAEALTAEEREAVAHPCGNTGDGEYGDPDAVIRERELIYDHEGDKGIYENGDARKGAGSAHAL